MSSVTELDSLTEKVYEKNLSVKTSVLIRVEGVAKHFPVGLGKVSALKTITLNVHEGEFLSILGPSGSGKSTLLHILGLLSKPTAGKIFFEGINISSYPENYWANLRSKRIGFVFQSFHLLNALSALENVEMPLIYQHIPPHVRKLKALEALEKVGMTHRSHHFPYQLSGGEAQRVAIARALVSSASIILADEPTGNLDTQTGKDILALLKTLNKEGKTLIIVTHDGAIASYADRKVFLQDGSLSQCSNPD